MRLRSSLFKTGVKGDSCFGCVYCLLGGSSCVIKGTIGRVDAGLKGLGFPLSCEDRVSLPKGLPNPDRDVKRWQELLKAMSSCPGMSVEYVPIAFDYDILFDIHIAKGYGDWLKAQNIKINPYGEVIGPNRFIKGHQKNGRKT